MLATVVLALVSSAIALALGEAIVRIKNADMRNYDIEMWRYAKLLKVPSADPVLGHEHRPNSEALLQSVEIRTNKWGMRGAEPGAPLAGQRRILFLGGSITLGWGVREEDTMTALLEKRLRDEGQSVVVMNAGVGNYNAPRAVELFLTKFGDVEPTDIVVHYFLRDAEKLDAGGGNWLLRNSELAMTLWIAGQRIAAKAGEKSLVEHYREVYRPDAQGFVEMTAALSRLADYARPRGIRLYLAMVPDVHNLEHYEFGFVHQTMADVAKRLGYAYVDLLPAFGKLSPKEVWAMPGDPHPNAVGHKLMADALYPLLSAGPRRAAAH